MPRERIDGAGIDSLGTFGKYRGFQWLIPGTNRARCIAAGKPFRRVRDRSPAGRNAQSRQFSNVSADSEGIPNAPWKPTQSSAVTDMLPSLIADEPDLARSRESWLDIPQRNRRHPP
ncbi:hypothetical protein [Burkholderia mayonis]|uniref:hypothetical protein n=1 Tax=Burkholderia mayonis TaxID=1385591 RepID=UPI00131F0B48|nr:hypothetical protein [Burkholderia mayonis]